jgi:flavin reductase (DIM6/NTAB) family NADH-FMN oxidoreductase RutF
MPVLMVATYNEDGSVNVMNLHEATRTVEGDMCLCIGESKRTHENIEMRKAFTIALVNQNNLAAVDFFGTVSGYREPKKFENTGLKARKSTHIDAPIIEGSSLVIECELRELVRTGNFSTIIGAVVDVAADESALDENGKIDAAKSDMILYNSFNNTYISLNDIVGKAWVEGKKYL